MNNIDNYFNSLLLPNVVHDLNLIRNYTNYDEVIKSYKEYYNNDYIDTNKEKIHINTKVYEIPFNLYGGCSLKVFINVTKLCDLLQEYKCIQYNKRDYLSGYRLQLNNDRSDIEYLNFVPSFIRSILDEENIDKKYAISRVNSNEPIIIGDINGLVSKKQYTIIDGNHRAYSKAKVGKNTEGYIISRNIWFKALLTDEDRKFIRITTNINSILLYRMGIINKNNIDQYMYKI